MRETTRHIKGLKLFIGIDDKNPNVVNIVLVEALYNERVRVFRFGPETLEQAHQRIHRASADFAPKAFTIIEEYFQQADFLQDGSQVRGQFVLRRPGPREDVFSPAGHRDNSLRVEVDKAPTLSGSYLRVPSWFAAERAFQAAAAEELSRDDR